MLSAVAELAVVIAIIVFTVLIIIISVLWQWHCLFGYRMGIENCFKNCCNNMFSLGHTI